MYSGTITFDDGTRTAQITGWDSTKVYLDKNFSTSGTSKIYWLPGENTEFYVDGILVTTESVDTIMLQRYWDHWYNDVNPFPFEAGYNVSLSTNATGSVSINAAGGLSYTWPSAHAAGPLVNDGSGTLSWTAGYSGTFNVITDTGTTNRLTFVNGVLTSVAVVP